MVLNLLIYAFLIATRKDVAYSVQSTVWLSGIWSVLQSWLQVAKKKEKDWDLGILKWYIGH